MSYKTRAQRKQDAESTIIHAMAYIRRLEFSPANGQALRILEFCLAEMTR